MCDADGIGQLAPSAGRILAIKMRRRRRAYIEAVGNLGGSVPRWTSRRHWLDDVSSWVYGEGAPQLRRRVAPATFVKVCAALAEFADSADGRHCAVTNRVVAQQAGCKERTVSTVRSILASTGLAVLAKQGSGGGGRPNRVAVWHLVARRQPVDKRRVCALPPSRRDRGLSHLGKTKPTRTRPRKLSSTTRKQRPPASARPLPLQRLAAALVSRTQGLAGVHIGAICDVLVAAGVDPATTTAERICQHLDADMRETGWSWPNEVQRPAAFLRYRLDRIADRLQPPPLIPERVGGSADGNEDTQERCSARPLRRVQRAEEDCSVCGAQDSPRRPWLPSRRARVCDPCWTVAAHDVHPAATAVAGAGL